MIRCRWLKIKQSFMYMKWAKAAAGPGGSTWDPESDATDCFSRLCVNQSERIIFQLIEWVKDWMTFKKYLLDIFFLSYLLAIVADASLSNILVQLIMYSLKYRCLCMIWLFILFYFANAWESRYICVILSLKKIR